MKNISSLALVLAVALLSCRSSTITKIDFDDLSTLSATTAANPTPHAVKPGDRFVVGDVLTERISGIQIVVMPFQWPAHPPAQPKWTHDGYVTIEHGNKAGGSGNEIHFNNASLATIAPVGKKLKRITLKFADYGGNVNLTENGVLHNVDDFASIGSPTMNGLILKVTGTGPAALLELSGTMKPSKFPGPLPPSVEGKDPDFVAVTGGGQELWIDDLEFE